MSDEIHFSELMRKSIQYKKRKFPRRIFSANNLQQTHTHLLLIDLKIDEGLMWDMEIIRTFYSLYNFCIEN